MIRKGSCLVCFDDDEDCSCDEHFLCLLRFAAEIFLDPHCDNSDELEHRLTYPEDPSPLLPCEQGPQLPCFTTEYGVRCGFYSANSLGQHIDWSDTGKYQHWDGGCETYIGRPRLKPYPPKSGTAVPATRHDRDGGETLLELRKANPATHGLLNPWLGVWSDKHLSAFRDCGLGSDQDLSQLATLYHEYGHWNQDRRLEDTWPEKESWFTGYYVVLV